MRGFPDDENQTFIDMSIYLRSLLMVSTICMLGLTGCTSVGAGAGKELHAALVAKMDPHRANQNKYSGEQQ
jgi:hypothetical protein